MTAFYHVCFAVPDIEAAMGDLERATGTGWSPPRADRIGDWDFRIAFTRGGPPFIELIEGSAGSPWHAPDGGRFHHLGYWSGSLADASPRLAERGFPVDFSGCPHGRPFAYHRVDSLGARLELVDVARQPAFLRTWHPGGPPMPVLDEGSEP